MLLNLVNARIQMDGILGERGLIENAVFHVPIKMLKPFGGYKIIVYLCAV